MSTTTPRIRLDAAPRFEPTLDINLNTPIDSSDKPINLAPDKTLVAQATNGSSSTTPAVSPAATPSSPASPKGHPPQIGPIPLHTFGAFMGAVGSVTQYVVFEKLRNSGQLGAGSSAESAGGIALLASGPALQLAGLGIELGTRGKKDERDKVQVGISIGANAVGLLFNGLLALQTGLPNQKIGNTGFDPAPMNNTLKEFLLAESLVLGAAHGALGVKMFVSGKF